MRFQSNPHTFHELDEMLLYNPDTGLFLWKKAPNQNKPAGTVAGTFRPDGYVSVGYRKRIYMAHRLAVLLMTKQWPRGVVDHINGTKTDNRYENLRVTTHALNCRNQAAARTNKSGFKGVYWREHLGKFAASIRVNWKLHHLGYFRTAEEASAAYNKASLDLHGEFGRLSTLTPSPVTVDAMNIADHAREIVG